MRDTDEAGFPERLRSLRVDRGITQEKLAEMVGSTTWAVRSWETGRRTPRDKQLFELARVLNVSPLWLREGRKL
jgi:transcriptional regulator with XRE-family HTH domain